MSVWLLPTVAEHPNVNLTSWAAYEVDVPGLGGATIHVVGDTGMSGRVTSPVQSVDAATRSVVTRSRRVYRLHGALGISDEAEFAWRRWLLIFDVTVLHEVTERLMGQFAYAEVAGADPCSAQAALPRIGERPSARKGGADA